MKEIKSIKWLLGALVLILVILLLNWSCKPTAYTEQVTRGQAVDVVSANLKIEETYRLTIRSEGSGRVISSLLNLGDAVQAGKTIIKLDTTELELKIEKIQIDLDAFRKRLKLGSPLKFQIEQVKDKLEELEALDETGSASPDTLKAWRRQLAEIREKMDREKINNEANLNRLENELEQNLLTLERMTIKSPVDGIIVAVDVFEGDLISDRTGIAEIISNERRVIAKISEEDFAKVEAEIKQAIEESPDLKELQKHLVIDQTPEGLRIQIVDRAGKPMFTSGSSRMQKQTRLLLTKITQVVRDLPNKISISGHTHSTPFRGSRKGYGNWELSSNRALASRRVIVEGGLNLKQISHVSGKEATQPLIKDNPKDARNRRISIVLLREAGKNA